ncbi:uncharacterized protein [Watersipora subatra]|uniref:uncharacterized protein n=1 Tax=Watersipora subatra TaxID=2589382 RepID=UPI00355C7A02
MSEDAQTDTPAAQQPRVPPLRIKVDNPKSLDFANAATEWSDWLRRFKRFCNISGLAYQSNEVQVDTLLYIMGRESDDIYDQLEFDEEEERTLDVVTEAFTQYFQPRRNVLHYRTQFYQRKQGADESAEEYIRAIHALASKCRFSTGLTQTDMVKDRLLSGMIDTSLSSELQLNEDVSLATVTSKMRAKETISMQMQNETKVAAVKLGSSKSKFNKAGVSKQAGGIIRDCRYCGRSHAPRSCPAFGKNCKLCEKPNHFAAVCKQKLRQTDEVTVDRENSEYSDQFFIQSSDTVHAIEQSSYRSVFVDGFLLDDGCDVSSVDSEWLIELVCNGNDI